MASPFDPDYKIAKAVASFHGSPYIAKNCDCWEGYKRVPGTKPCAPGSCEKCDTHAKKESRKVSIAEGLTPMQEGSDFPAMHENGRRYDSKEGYEEDQWRAFVDELNQSYSDICASYGLHNAERAGVAYNGAVIQPKIDRWGQDPSKTHMKQPAVMPDGYGFDPGQRPHLIKMGVDPALLGLEPLSDQELENFQWNQEVAYPQYVSKLCRNLQSFGWNPPKGMTGWGNNTVNVQYAPVPEGGWRNGHVHTASQGDKPSPNAAQAVLDALKADNQEEAKELLKMTDCPEGCETHPEGKCPHQYMSAGRTRVRYLINDSSFDKSEDSKAPADESLAIEE